MRSYLLALALLLGGLHPALAATLVVVANPAPAGFHPSLRELARIYRREQRITEAGAPLIPVNLPARDPLRRAFSLALFGEPPEALLDYWDQMYFHGISPPKVLGSQVAVLRFVASTPGAIGYVAGCRLPPGVREVLRLPLPDSATTRGCGGEGGTPAAGPGGPTGKP